MTKEFVPYELALKLKQLGFYDECIAYYDLRNDLEFFGGDNLKDTHCVQLNAPLFQQAFRWFREKFNLESHIKKDWENGICLGYESIIECEDGIIDCGTHNIYEEAELACLDKLIAILETKQQEQ